MPRRSAWELTPQQSIEAECAGRAQVVAGCVALMSGATSDAALIRALAGPAAEGLLSGRSRADPYWYRVWGARGLLWAYLETPGARAAIIAALADEAWRVREMAAKVVARHLVEAAFAEVVVLRDDPVERVQVAAERALIRLSAAES